MHVIATISPQFQEGIEQTIGKVYTLNPQGFERDPERGLQAKSHQPVRPVGSVDVVLADFYAMGGQVNWEELPK